ncbi:MAG: hypothetical protein LUC18_02740 [Porphyromonadaceae bacterium]|nr:hypothetical protein [Porphyromonadaceae bacterium]
MSDSRIEQINATLAELGELMQLIDKSYPDVSPVLWKVSLERGLLLCEEIKALSTVKESAVKVESATVDDEKTSLEEKSPEKSPFSWEATEEEFCLFDSIPGMKDTTGEESSVDGGDKISKDVESPEKKSDEEKLSVDPETEDFPQEKVEAAEVATVSEESVGEENKNYFCDKKLQKMMSINDRFLFRREFFDGDDGLMEDVLDALNNIMSYEASLAYLHDHFSWDFDSEAFALFRSLLQQRFE